MRQPEFLKRLRLAKDKALTEISHNSSRGGIYATGFSNEGYAGGYYQALIDVEAMLVHGFPSDPRRYWKVQP